jgi:LemA protein
MNQVLTIVVLLGVLICCVWAISTANRFARLEKLVQEAWANVDVALKRRHDLIPNLVETVKAYAAHERELLEELIHARDKAVNGSAPDESQLARVVNTVIARAEAYPDLKASENFIELQYELSNSEDRIAAARRFYNANVRDFNILLASFPARVLSGGRAAKEFYEVETISVRTSSIGGIAPP